MPALLFRSLETEGAATSGAASDLVDLVNDSERPPAPASERPSVPDAAAPEKAEQGPEVDPANESA